MAEPWKPKPGERCWFHSNTVRSAVTIGERGSMWPFFTRIIVRVKGRDYPTNVRLERLFPMSAVDQLAELDHA